MAEKAEAARWVMDLGRCTICPAEGGVCDGPIDGHHCVSKQALKRRGLFAHLWDRRNRVPVCRFRHEQETSGYKPIPRGLLPASVFEFADELGLRWWVEKHYPASLDEQETDPCVGLSVSCSSSEPAVSEREGGTIGRRASHDLRSRSETAEVPA